MGAAQRPSISSPVGPDEHDCIASHAHCPDVGLPMRRISLRATEEGRCQVQPIRPYCSVSSETGARTGHRPAARKSASRFQSQHRPRRNRPAATAIASYAFVSTRPSEKVKNEVSVIVGYPQKPGHDATAAIGSATYAMYTQNDGAWVKNAAEEAQMVDAMRKGSDLVVKSESGARHQDHRYLFAQGYRAGARQGGGRVQVTRC